MQTITCDKCGKSHNVGETNEIVSYHLARTNIDAVPPLNSVDLCVVCHDKVEAYMRDKLT